MYSDTIKEILSLRNLELVLSSDWASSKEGHRPKIRQALLNDISKRTSLSEEQKRVILDLSITPVVPGFTVSISHCRQMGGYLRTSDQSPIGLDIEVTERVTADLARRLSFDEKEWQGAPSPSSLWVAKEAAFKSLFHVSKQPDVASQVKVGGWKRWNDEIETCEIVEIANSAVPVSVGCVFEMNGTKLSCFTLR